MKPVLTVVADDNMPGVEACLAHLQPSHDVQLRRLAGRQMQSSDLIGCDWLLVRSITQVNAALLAAHQPQFIRSEERRVGKECRSRWSPYH